MYSEKFILLCGKNLFYLHLHYQNMKHFKKHHTILFCVIFSSIFISASCNKETGPTSVNGTVRDVTNNTPVADAEVGLVETDGESSFGLGGTLLEEKYADATGNFTFDFTAKKIINIMCMQ